MNRKSLGITYQSVLLGLGLYFFCRIFRNNLYFPLIAPVQETNPALHEGLRYLGHLIFLAGLFLYFALVKEERFCLKSAVFSKEKKSLKLLLLGFLSGFLMNGASIYAAVLHGDMDMVARGFDPLMLLFVFLCIFVQSSTEEFQFRLWTYNRIADKAAIGYAVIGSAVAFSLSHMLNAGISFVALLNIFLIGVLWALSLYCFDSIWFACAYHTAWNFSQNCIFGLPNSGNPAVLTVMGPTYTKESFFYDPEFGVEGTVFTTILNLIAIAVFLVLIKRKGWKRQNRNASHIQ